MTMLTSSPTSATVNLQQLMDASNRNDHRLAQALSAMIAASAQALATQTSTNQAAAAQLNTVANVPFQRFRLDSRQVAPNDVFVLLKSHTPNCQKSRDTFIKPVKMGFYPIRNRSNCLLPRVMCHHAILV